MPAFDLHKYLSSANATTINPKNPQCDAWLVEM